MNRPIKARLASLPYREMRELAKQIADTLLDHNTADDETNIATVLSGLAAQEDSEAVAKEQQLLHAMFTRKKQLTIQPYENGFKVSCPAQGIDVYTDDIRDGISQVLDNLVVMKVME